MRKNNHIHQDGATVSQNRETATEPVRRVSGLAIEINMRKHTQSLKSGVIGSDVTSAQRFLTYRAKNHAGRRLARKHWYAVNDLVYTFLLRIPIYFHTLVYTI